MGIAEFDERGRLRRVEVRVAGGSAEENAELHNRIFEATVNRAMRRSPWVSGSFYLVVALTMLAVLLVIARLAPAWSIAPVVLGGVLLVAVVGAFQLRQDDRLSEQGFLTLMRMALGKLPSLVRSRHRPGHPDTPQPSPSLGTDNADTPATPRGVPYALHSCGESPTATPQTPKGMPRAYYSCGDEPPIEEHAVAHPPADDSGT